MCEQRRDVAGDVLVDPVEADEGVEDEELGFERLDGGAETEPVVLLVEAERAGGDDVDGQARERDAGGGADALEAAAHDVERVLGGVEQDGPGLDDGEAAEAGLAGGDGDGHVEGEEGLAALGLAADDADGLGGPEIADEPAVLLGDDGEIGGEADGELLAHRRLSLATARAARGGGAEVSSRKSFSSSCLSSRSQAAARSSEQSAHRTR